MSDPIKTVGMEIVGFQKMKRSGLRRITLELTEFDSRKHEGVLSIAEGNKVLLDGEFTFTKVQDEHQLPTPTGNVDKETGEVI